MNRKVAETQTLLTRIQNQLFDNKKDVSTTKAEDRLKNQKLLPKKKQYASGLNSAQLKSRSSEKPTQKSDSYENLFTKKSQMTITGKNQRHSHMPQKLHQSFSHHPNEQYSESRYATKSLHFTQFQNGDGGDQSRKDFGKGSMKIQEYFQKYSDLLNKCPKPLQKDREASEMVPDKHKHISVVPSQFEEFKIQDINSLIDLIDNCVQQANAYIRDLTNKVEVMQQEIEQLRKSNRRMEEYNKVHLSLIKEKDEIIERLTAEKNKKGSTSKNEDIKHLLKMIQELNQENASLKIENDSLKAKQISPSEVERKGKQIYNEIHRKIQILNISVNQKPGKGEGIEDISDSSKAVDDTVDRVSLNSTNQRTSEANRKYKFIKPKV